MIRNKVNFFNHKPKLKLKRSEEEGEQEWTEMENNPDRWWPMETELKGEWYGE